MLVSKADSWMIDNGMKFFFMQKSVQLTQRIYFELKLSVGVLPETLYKYCLQQVIQIQSFPNAVAFKIQYLNIWSTRKTKKW